MYLITGDTFGEVYRKSILEILKNGKEVSPRGSLTYELAPATLVINDPRKFLTAPELRKGNHTFQLAESLWMLRGSNDLEEIAHYNKVWRNFEDSDEPGILNGAYGERLRSWEMVVDQFATVFNKLQKDPLSRQAVMIIWDPIRDNIIHSSGNYSKDLPCTNYFAFQIRDGKLDMWTVMRSNDLHKGTIYDIPNFIIFQFVIAGWLGVEVGKYTHSAASFHIYESDVENLIEVYNDFNEQAVFDEESDSPSLSIEDFNTVMGIVNHIEEFTRVSDKVILDNCIFDIINSLEKIENTWWQSVAAQIAMYNYRKLGATKREFIVFLPYITNEYQPIVEKWEEIKK